MHITSISEEQDKENYFTRMKEQGQCDAIPLKLMDWHDV
jgi:hypothetical protein